MRIEMSANWVDSKTKDGLPKSEITLGPYKAIVFEIVSASEGLTYIGLSVTHQEDKLYDGFLYQMYSFKDAQKMAEAVIREHHYHLHPELRTSVRAGSGRGTDMPGILINDNVHRETVNPDAYDRKRAGQ